MLFCNGGHILSSDAYCDKVGKISTMAAWSSGYRALLCISKILKQEVREDEE